MQLNTDPMQELLTPSQVPNVIGADGQVDKTVNSTEEAIVVGHHAITTKEPPTEEEISEVRLVQRQAGVVLRPRDEASASVDSQQLDLVCPKCKATVKGGTVYHKCGHWFRLPAHMQADAQRGAHQFVVLGSQYFTSILTWRLNATFRGQRSRVHRAGYARQHTVHMAKKALRAFCGSWYP